MHEFEYLPRFDALHAIECLNRALTTAMNRAGPARQPFGFNNNITLAIRRKSEGRHCRAEYGNHGRADSHADMHRSAIIRNDHGGSPYQLGGLKKCKIPGGVQHILVIRKAFYLFAQRSVGITPYQHYRVIACGEFSRDFGKSSFQPTLCVPNRPGCNRDQLQRSIHP